LHGDFNLGCPSGYDPAPSGRDAPDSSPLSQHLSSPALGGQIPLPTRLPSLYPVGIGSNATQLSIAPNCRQFRCPSASKSQQYRACFASCPPVFTNRCCTLVSEQFSVRLGNASRRNKSPRLQASRLTQSRTLFERNRLRRVPLEPEREVGVFFPRSTPLLQLLICTKEGSPPFFEDDRRWGS
jgi:hypothetical protein